MSNNKFRVAVITWQDAHSGARAWMARDVVEQQVTENGAVMISAGVYIGKYGGCHVLSMGIADDGDFMGWLKIPVGTVINFKCIEFDKTKASKDNSTVTGRRR